MRNPARKALVYFTTTLIAATLLWLGVDRRSAIGDDWTTVVPQVLGVTGIFISVLFFLRALFHIRGRAKLLAGRDVLARWRVGPADWDRFRAFDQARAASDPYRLTNALWIRRRTPPEGVDIIVGRRSLLVDGSYHGLHRRGLPELRNARWLAPANGSPNCLEFALVYPTRTGASHQVLRIPVPAVARDEAQHVLRWFEARLRTEPALAFRNPQRTYRWGLGIAAFCFAAAAGGWLLASANGFKADGDDFLSLAPFTLMLVGTIIGIAALIVALMTFLTSAVRRRDGSGTANSARSKIK